MEIKKDRIIATPRSKYYKYLSGGSSSSSSGSSASIDTTNFVKKMGELSQTVEGDFIATGAVVAKFKNETYTTDFPIASANLLGLIKVGANLTIDANGVLNATGGGLTSVDWSIITSRPTTFNPSSHTHLFADITDKPTKLSQFTNDLDFSSYATNLYVNNQISNLVNSAPETLNTLKELSDALGNDPNFATSMSTLIGTKWTQDNAKITNWDSAYTHISDSIKHLTSTERTNWNNAYTHISDSVKHITATERTNWNNGYSYSQIGHLPLSGGTLSGDLNGTNGYFSGAVVAKYQSSTYIEDFPIAGTNVYGTIKYDGTTIGINANGQLTIVGGAGVSSWNDLTDKPTTLSGYGITDAALLTHIHTFASLTDKPTTLSGYGILATDILFDTKYAASSHTHNYLSTLKVGSNSYNVSSNSITIPAYPTALPASDVYSWAKASVKPSYTYSEVGAASAGHTHTGVYQPLDNDLTTIAGLTSTGLLKRTGTDSWSLDSTSYLPSASYTAADVLSKIKTVDGSGSGLDADLLDGKEATAFVLSSDILYSSSGNYATYANKIPRLDSTLGALEIGQFIDLHGTTSSVDYTHRLISYGDGFQIKTPSGTYSYVFDNTGKFTSPGAIVAKYSSASYATDWPIASATLLGVVKAGVSINSNAGVINLSVPHYTTVSSFTTKVCKDVTAKIALGTGTMASGTLDQIKLDFLPTTTSFGLTSNVIATNTGAGMSLLLSFREDAGTGRWYLMIYNGTTASIVRDGIYLSINAKQTV